MDAPHDAKARFDAVLRALAPRIDALITPALAIDLEAVDHNVAAMAAFAGPGRWRPHVKTHKHPAVIRACVQAGVSDFKCATLDELQMVLDTAGEVDVLVAYPLPPAGAAAAARLAARHPTSTVRLLLDSPEHLRRTDAALADAPARLTALLDVDVGMRRTGTPAAKWRIEHPGNLELVGLHGYEGHIRWTEADAAASGYDALVQLARAVPFDVRWIVTSGTHAFAHALAHDGLREGPWRHQVSPGTLVLSDLRTAPAAALLELRQAALVLSRVISSPGPGRITLDAGSKALNPDCPAPGCAAVGHPSVVAETASEEHRPCRTEGTAPALGQVVGLVPEHVCTTVNMYRRAQFVRGDRDLGEAPIVASSRSHDFDGFR